MVLESALWLPSRLGFLKMFSLLLSFSDMTKEKKVFKPLGYGKPSEKRMILFRIVDNFFFYV